MTVFFKDGSQADIPLMGKPAVAQMLLDIILARLEQRP